MIVVADSGSTKINWSLLENKQVIGACTTEGMNPYFLSSSEMLCLLKESFPLKTSNVEALYFYGAGCTPEKEKEVSSALSAFFNANQVEVKSDLWAAARSLGQNESGIVCILGTGSNSCYYDGKKIIENVSPLGYILGDEASGAYFGKRLIGDILKKQLPSAIINDFFETYSITKEEIIERIYRGKFPNRFLAQYTFFLKSHEHEPEIRNMLNDGFDSFIQRNIYLYGRKDSPVHFTGSIAYHFRECLEQRLNFHSFQIGKICQEPMSGLVEYHTQ